MCGLVVQWSGRPRRGGFRSASCRRAKVGQLIGRKGQVILSDDLDENLSADETVSFSLDGTSYEIDLADKNAKELREVFSRYVSAARKVGRGSRTSGAGGGGGPPPSPPGRARPGGAGA